MKFLYEQCGKRIECIYWSNPLKLAELEHDAKYVDEVQVWYPLTLDEEVKERYGNVLSYIELSNKWGARTASKWINLVASEKEILHGFSKNARYEVRRACNRDDLRIFFYSDENLTEKILEQYYDFYDKFAQTKEMTFLGRDKIGTLVRQRAYMIGVVQDAKGVWLTAHGNILSHADGIVALCTSSSLFREDRKHAQLIARANRYLHYREMCWGKQQGYRVYDMGGYYVREDFWMDVDMDDNEYIKVSNFKDSLGGDIKYFKAGYIFQCSAYRNIVFNLEKNKELLGRKKIILYGYAQWGRFVEKYLREHFGLIPYVRIDNKLFKRNKSLYNSEVLQRLIADDAIVLLTLDEKNCRIVMQESNIQPYKQVRHIVCVKLK